MYRWQRRPAAHTVLAGKVQIEHSKGTGVLYPSVQTFINRIACDPLLKANILELIKETSRLFELLVHQTQRTRLFPPDHSTQQPAAEWLVFPKQQEWNNSRQNYWRLHSFICFGLCVRGSSRRSSIILSFLTWMSEFVFHMLWLSK